MSDGEFADFLSACRGELQVKQTGIAECLKRRPYAYDIDQGLLTLGSEAHSMVVIGTYCVSRRTWLWGWANDSYSDAARERSASLKGLRDLTGFQVFADDGLMATASDALDLVAIAVHYFAADGYWQEDFTDLQVFWPSIHNGRHDTNLHRTNQGRTRRAIQWRVTLLFEFGLPSPPWMAYMFA
jgi:hypothetical protein